MKGDSVIVKTIQDKIFPTYTLQVLDTRTVVVGGGGSPKSGAFSGLVFVNVGHDGETFTSKPLSRASTDDVPVDTMAIHVSSEKKFIVVGRSDKCVVYSAELKLTEPDNENPDGAVEKSAPSQIRGLEVLDLLRLGYFVREVGSCKASDNGEVTRVRISKDASLVVTGSVDGHVRIFSMPGMESLRKIQAHAKEVLDLDISGDGQKIVTVGADSCGYVWQLDGKKLSQLELPSFDKYKFRRCKFTQGNETRPALYTICNPPMKSKHPSLLQRWNTRNFLVEEVAHFRDALSSVAVSEDSRFVAIGTMTGHVMLHDARSLQRLHWFKEVHGSAITALEFLPPALPFVSTRGDIEVAVVSVALDGFTKIHSLTNEEGSNFGIGFLMILLVILATYLVVEMLELGVEINTAERQEL